MSTTEKVKTLLADMLGIEPARVIPGAAIIDDLGADSLDTMEIAMEIEEMFHIEISDEELDGIVTVADLMSTLEARL